MTNSELTQQMVAKAQQIYGDKDTTSRLANKVDAWMTVLANACTVSDLTVEQIQQLFKGTDLL